MANAEEAARMASYVVAVFAPKSVDIEIKPTIATLIFRRWLHAVPVVVAIFVAKEPVFSAAVLILALVDFIAPPANSFLGLYGGVYGIIEMGVVEEIAAAGALFGCRVDVPIRLASETEFMSTDTCHVIAA